MRKFLGIGAVILGVVGVLASAAIVGLGWWAALRTSAQVDQIASRLDRGLATVDLKLANVQARLDVVCKNLNAVRGAAEAMVAANPELPRIRAEIEALIVRLAQSFDRAEALADSLGSVAEGLRTAADVVDHLRDNVELTVRARQVADRIDHAAELLSGLRARVNASNSAKAVQLARDLVTIAREVIAGSERLAEGLTTARQEITVVRKATADVRDEVLSWIIVTVIATALIGLWKGLGQMCLIGWGRRSLHPALQQA